MSRASERMASRAKSNSVYVSKQRLARKQATNQIETDENEPPNSARELIKKGRRVHVL